mgnify:CR=1 FL=1
MELVSLVEYWVKFLLKQIFKDFLSCGFRLMEDKPIINSGIIMGTPLAMMKLLYFVATVGSYLDLNEKYAAGQGILNFVYYFGMLLLPSRVIEVNRWMEDSFHLANGWKKVQFQV